MRPAWRPPSRPRRGSHGVVFDRFVRWHERIGDGLEIAAAPFGRHGEEKPSARRATTVTPEPHNGFEIPGVTI
jgi:hypothetical protein